MALVLVVDDDEQVRKILKTTIERGGHEVIAASNGLEAAEIFRQRPAQVIVTDIVMPEKEGIEMIIELRKEFPEVKIVAVSGGGSFTPEVYLGFAKDLGANQKFTKPVDGKQLLQAIDELAGQ